MRRLVKTATMLAILATSSLAHAQSMPAPHSGKPYDSARLGHMTLRATTRSPEAQRLFQQGVALCYAFNHDEAVRSFRRALAIDPEMAAAHWGIAFALGPNINFPMDPDHEKDALAELHAAQARLAGTSPLEHELIDALGARYGEPAGDARAARDSGYAVAMQALAARHPDDPDVLALTADALLNLTPWKWWTPDGQPTPAVALAIPLLEHGLAKDSLHTGLNHLYIHAVEESPDPGRALPMAARLARLAPDAGHLVHMPSHIWSRVGDYHASALQNVKAARIDSAYIASHEVSGIYPMMYRNHNLDFAAVAFLEEGRLRDALHIADPLSDSAVAMAAVMPPADGFASRALVMRVADHRWDEILRSPPLSPTVPISALVWRFAQGMAHAGKHQTAEAQVDLDSLSAGIARMPADAQFGFNSSTALLGIARGMLAGALARSREDLTTATHELRAAAAAYDALAYDEPEDWLLPPQIPLGGVLLQTHDFTGAEGAFRAELKHHPHHGRALLGLALALEGEGKQAEAAAMRKEFAAAWQHADKPLAAADL